MLPAHPVDGVGRENLSSRDRRAGRASPGYCGPAMKHSDGTPRYTLTPFRGWDSLQAALAGARARLAVRAALQRVESLADLRAVIELRAFEIYAATTLARQIARLAGGEDLPWTPRPSAEDRRIALELLIQLECDDDGCGGYLSHFELALAALAAAGGDAQPAERFVQRVRRGESLQAALEAARVPSAARSLLQATWSVTRTGGAHRAAAAFALCAGEGLGDGLAPALVMLESKHPGTTRHARRLAERECAVDQGEFAARIGEHLQRACGEDSIRWAEAEESARSILWARASVWETVRARLGQAPIAAPAVVQGML
jgi:hypothetical protein